MNFLSIPTKIKSFLQLTCNFLDVEEICLLPLSAGYGKGDKRCELSSRVLYYYNPYSSDCQEFYYYGCGGNENRFSTHAECKIRCMRKIPTSVAILEKRNLRGISEFSTTSKDSDKYVVICFQIVSCQKMKVIANIFQMRLG